MSNPRGGPGRKPTPTALRLLRGNPGKRPLNPREPKVTPTLPKPPMELSAAARREWYRTGRQLLALGLMTDLDRAAFAAFCVSYTRWLEVTALLAKMPVCVKAANGLLVANPLLAVAARAQDQYFRALSEFGMSPTTRSRVQALAPEESDPFDVLFGGGSADARSS